MAETNGNGNVRRLIDGGIAIAIVTLVFWSGVLYQRVQVVEAAVASSSETRVRLARSELRLDRIEQSLDRIEQKLERERIEDTVRRGQP